MNVWPLRVVAFSLVAGCLGALPALAGVRSAGETFVYELSIASNIKEDFSQLPASVRGTAAANMAAANKTTTLYVLTLSTDRVNANGSAHVNVTFTNSGENGHGPAAVFAQVNQFDATLTADGRFLPKYDPNMQMTVDAHGMLPPEEMHNSKAESMAGFFGDFNTFASGCAARPHMKAGDVWQVVSQDRYGMQRTYQFGVGADSGNGVPTVTMKGNFASPNSTSTVDATGHYDRSRGLVLDLHEETAYQNTPPSGVASSGTSVNDYKLRQ